MSSQTTAPAGLGPDDLRLVLFGRPAAGKTSLLGALARAAEDQKSVLGGTLVDESQGLADLREQLYVTTQRRTPEEIVEYPVRYEPLPADGHAPKGKPVDAVLLDCDGRVAIDLIAQHKDPEHKGAADGPLVREILEADALLLVIDASAQPEEVEENFSEFASFVRTFERGRRQRVEVGGLPVFLVLTKCDLLARAGDSPADWFERIEERKTEVDEHFRDFMAREAATEKASAPAKQAEAGNKEETPFGRINLHVWATAVKRPQLAGSPAKAEPYGVAELFRQCLREAEVYRDREEQAELWLKVVTVGVVGLVAVLLTLIVVFWISNRSSQLKQLALRVQIHRDYHKGTPAERLSGLRSDLKTRLERLQEIRDDPQFGHLKKDQQEFVLERIDELKGYLDYLERVLAERDRPAEKSEEGLKDRVERLNKQGPEGLALPDEEWAQTQAGEERKLMLDRAAALLAGADQAERWYFEAGAGLSRLWASATGKGTWTVKAREALDPNQPIPFTETTPLSEPLNLTYADVLRFDRVRRAKANYQREQQQLRSLLNVLAALRIIPPSKERPAVLEFPVDFPLGESAERLEQLRQHYPDYETTFVLSAMPESVRQAVIDAANENYQWLLKAGQKEVLRQLGGKEPKDGAGWEKLREWLQAPTELASWRVLARALRNLRPRATADDPVTELAKFLAQERFTVSPRAFILGIPERNPLEPNRNSSLVIGRSRQGKRLPNVKYELAGEPKPVNGVLTYRYQAADDGSWEFLPGDLVWAHLDLSGNKKRLNWMTARTQRYSIERLSRPPREEDIDDPTKYRTVEGITLRPEPAGSVPQVPDLLPGG